MKVIKIRASLPQSSEKQMTVSVVVLKSAIFLCGSSHTSSTAAAFVVDVSWQSHFYCLSMEMEKKTKQKKSNEFGFHRKS